MLKRASIFLIITFFIFISCKKTTSVAPAPGPPLPNTIDKTDTLTIATYNVLNYGDGCQGSVSTLNNYFKTIIQYIHPDLLACVKTNAFPPTSGLPGNLAQEINDSVLNVIFPNNFSYINPTNQSNDDAMDCLFYNNKKLTYLYTQIVLNYISDFDMYKFYYNDPNLSITHDTTFLYVVVNHTKSGSSSGTRDQQVAEEMDVLRGQFAVFPNLVSMGDFNTNNSSEPGYQDIMNNGNSSTEMNDPPFYPDRVFNYPADWTTYPNLYASDLTTSTRQLDNVPNTCGTDGGGKSWYDHIFISPWITDSTNYMWYIPFSYKTMGNDGHRVGESVNSLTPFANVSAPGSVINAMFQFSNKYPVTIKLRVKANRNAFSPKDP